MSGGSEDSEGSENLEGRPRAGARGKASRPVDGTALARHAARLMRQPAPWLHAEVARRMAERLQVLRRPPQQVVDWGARLGGSEAALRHACPGARRIAVEAFEVPGSVVAERPAVNRLHVPRWWSAARWWPACGRAGAAAPHERTLPEGEADLLWSNMVLHHLAEPESAFARWRQLLAVEGILMFSTLGPGTFESLRRLYAARRWPSPHAPFVDMHDLGDMLVHAGFADPVMDQELITLTWATPGQALAELRQLGGNADPGRCAGLRTPRWRGALEQALAQGLAQAHSQAGAGERIALEFEIVYGHAVRPPPRPKLAAETAVSLQEMRGMLRSRGGAGA